MLQGINALVSGKFDKKTDENRDMSERIGDESRRIISQLSQGRVDWDLVRAIFRPMSAPA